MKIVAAFLLVLASAAASADIELQTEQVSGRVTDSKEGVADAYVVALFVLDYSSIAGGRPMCMKSIATITDNLGNYRIPAWRTAFPEPPGGPLIVDSLSVHLFAYKPGYRLVQSERAGVRGKRGFAKLPPSVINLSMQSSDRDEAARVEYIDRLIRQTACDKNAEALTFYEALERETAAYPSAVKKSEGEMSLTEKIEAFASRARRRINADQTEQHNK